MASKPRLPMPISERAKQFAPFMALKGYPEHLSTKEKIKDKRIIIAEDEAESLNQKLTSLEIGSEAEIKYYFDEQYITARGIISKIDTINRIFYLNDEPIKAEEIISVTDIQ